MSIPLSSVPGALDEPTANELAKKANMPKSNDAGFSSITVNELPRKSAVISSPSVSVRTIVKSTVYSVLPVIT